MSNSKRKPSSSDTVSSGSPIRTQSMRLRLARAYGARPTTAVHYSSSGINTAKGFSLSAGGANPFTITQEDAVELRLKLGSFAEYWDDSEMDVYDAL
jgi:hypothetical protein